MLVEQRSTQEAGTSIAPCTTSTSTNWYLAEGFTAEDSTEQLVLTNPFDQTVIVDVGFATDEGSREPPQLQGFPVAAALGAGDRHGLDRRARRGRRSPCGSAPSAGRRLLVGRAQLYDGGGRLGYSMTLASPVLRSQWWFANGSKGPGITERYSIYNPGDEDVQVAAAVPRHPGDVPVAVDPITVPAGEVVTFTPDTVTGLPDGRHGVRVRHRGRGPVARRRAGDHAHDRRRADDVGAARRRRHAARTAGADDVDARHRPGEPTEDALLVYNSDERRRHGDRPGGHARRARQRPGPGGGRRCRRRAASPSP